MRRLMIVLFAVALAACTTVEYRDYGYHGSPAGGDYYYGHAYDPPWYDPYDSLFWGLRYSYYDPFFYPHFYYGVTYFPRYYGWGVGWSSWYAWRYWHPYSPYYGSYWDHYYDWWRYQRPHHRDANGLDRRMAGRRAGMPASGAHAGPGRYGSARNAAERLAWQRQAGGVVPIRPRSATLASPAAEPLQRGRAVNPEAGGLPSRMYVPRERVRVDGRVPGARDDRDIQTLGERNRMRVPGARDDRFSGDAPAWRDGARAGAPVDAGRFERASPSVGTTERVRSLPPPPVPEQSSSAPIRQSRPEGRSAPAPSVERSAPSPRSSSDESRRASPRTERSRTDR